MSAAPVFAKVTHAFQAPAEKVFDAWLNAQMIGQFMFGPNLREEVIERLTLDSRVGGSFSFVVNREGKVIDHVGTYQEIERPQLLVFTWGTTEDKILSRVMINILPVSSGGCELMLIHELSPGWEAYISRVQASWQKMISTLDAILSTSL